MYPGPIKTNFGEPEVLDGKKVSASTVIRLPSRHVLPGTVEQVAAQMSITMSLPAAQVEQHVLEVPLTICANSNSGLGIAEQARGLVGLPLSILAATRSCSPGMIGDTLIAHAELAADRAREQWDMGQVAQVTSWRHADYARRLAVVSGAVALGAVAASVAAPFAAAGIVGMVTGNILHHRKEQIAMQLGPQIEAGKLAYTHAKEAAEVVRAITRVADNRATSPLYYS